MKINMSMKNYVKENFEIIAFSFFVILFIYSVRLFNYNIGVDTEQYLFDVKNSVSWGTFAGISAIFCWNIYLTE